MEDTYKQAQMKLAQMVLDSLLVEFIGFPGPNHERKLETLRRMVTEGADVSSWCFFNVEFIDCETNVNLDVMATPLSRDVVTDEGDNDWMEHVMTYRVNWPTHGSTD